MSPLHISNGDIKGLTEIIDHIDHMEEVDDVTALILLMVV